jgi:flagellar L-ring protein precursor FlgH
MASDRLASRVGDSLTVLIYESSQAQNTSQSSRQGGIQASGQAGSSTVNHSGQLSATAGYSGNGQTGRTEQMIAQISVVVDGVLPNGDLHVVGEQALKINGQHTRIRLRGRIRREDISSLNTVRSSMVADAAIDYDGAPLGTSERRSGVARRVLGWFGLH